MEARIRRILVPVHGDSTSDEPVLGLAGILGKRDRAEIVILYVIEVPRTLPIDADLGAEVERGEEALEKLEHVAERMGCHVETDVLQAREAGPAIVGEALERQVDVIVMAVPNTERFGAFSVETRALYVLQNAPCRVVLQRDPLNAPRAAKNP